MGDVSDVIPLDQIDLTILKEDGFMIPAGHEQVIATIKNNLPAIQQVSKNFGKRQSEFMNTMLTVSQPTPLRRLRQCCSEIERTWEAIRHHYYKYKELALKVESIEQDITFIRQALDVRYNETDQRKERRTSKLGLKLRKKQLKLEKIRSDIVAGEKYIGGALRRVSQLSEQYKQMLRDAGKEAFTEEDFEEEEIEYHIKTALLQGLTAARSNGGSIDEGNHIYLQQIGVHGAIAQKRVEELLHKEKTMMSNNMVPDMKLVWDWLDKCYNEFKPAVYAFAQLKGQRSLYFKDLCVGYSTDVD